MSNLYSSMNAIVLVGLCLAGYFIFAQPQEYGRPDDAWLQRAVIDRPEPMLVKFGAEWCGPCRMMEPVLDKFEAEVGGQVGVVRVNVDQYPGLARHYNVSSIPRLLLFNHGKVVADRVGSMDEQQLLRWVAAEVR